MVSVQEMMIRGLTTGLLALLLAACGGSDPGTSTECELSKAAGCAEPTPHWTADKCKAEDQGDMFGLCGDKNTVTIVCDAFVPNISSGYLNCLGPEASKDQSVGQVWCCYLPK